MLIVEYLTSKILKIKKKQLTHNHEQEFYCHLMNGRQVIADLQ